MKRLVAIVAAGVISVSIVHGDTFKLKLNKTGKLYGPFESLEGAQVVLGKAAFTVVQGEEPSETDTPRDSQSRKGLALISHKSGPCKLKEAKNIFDKENVFNVVLGDKVKASCNFHGRVIFKKFSIIASPKVMNTSEKPMYAHYYIAFFDKSGNLIGSSGHSMNKAIDPGASWDFTCLIEIPKKTLKEVASYQAVLYESEQVIGQ